MRGSEDESEEIEGRFWDPGYEDRRVRGRVVRERRIPRLLLEEPLRPAPAEGDPLERIRAMGRETADVIAGQSLTGEPLCLENCFVIQMVGAKVPHPQVWSVERLFIGADAPPRTIARLEVHLLGLRDFYGAPLLGDLTPTANANRERYTIDWLSSPRLEAQFGDVTVIFDDEMTVTGPAHQLTLNATPRIHVVPPEPRHLDDLRPDVGFLATLVGFCRGAAAELDQLWLVSADGIRVRCIERLRSLPEDDDDDGHPWLGIGNLNPLARTLERWRAFCVENENAVAMLAEYLRGPRRYMTIDRLLVLARFIEEYSHTSVAAGSMPPKDKFHQRVRFVQQRHTAALGQVMGHHHGEAFPKGVADTRHYHTHFNPIYAAKAATGLDLVILIDRLWVLVRACVLSELGFGDVQVAELLRLDPRFSWLAAQP
jgi:hypothetical protein